MNWTALMGMASTFAFLVPVLVIAAFRLYRQASLLALFSYYLFSAVYNLMSEGFLPVPAALARGFGTFNNYLDAPLMLLFLHFFCSARCRLRNLRWLLVAIIGYNLSAGLYFGFSVASNVYVLGPGIAVVSLTALTLFVKQVRLTIVQNKGMGKTLMLASVVFSYGCFCLIYLMHYVQRLDAVQDIFMLYYAVSLLSSALMFAGLLFIRHHLRELQELKTTRRELQVFFEAR